MINRATLPQPPASATAPRPAKFPALCIARMAQSAAMPIRSVQKEPLLEFNQGCKPISFTVNVTCWQAVILCCLLRMLLVQSGPQG